MGVTAKTDLGRKIEKYVSSQFERLFDRRRATSFDADGMVQTISHDPQEATADPVPMAQLRHVRVSAGDDVITARIGGEDVIIGALGDDADGGPIQAGGLGQHILPINVRAAATVGGTSTEALYQSARLDIELPPGRWEFNLMHSGRLRRTANSGRMGLGVLFANDYHYVTYMDRQEFGTVVYDLTQYHYMARSCVHMLDGGQSHTIYAVFGGRDTAAGTYIAQSNLFGTAIRVE